MENKILSIQNGETYLGIEFGSTRIKATLIDDKAQVLATGKYNWENQLVDGVWSYSIESIQKGLSACYLELKENVLKQYGLVIKKIKRIGISAMMHGYMPFDKKDELLVPYRTWRNTITEEASEILSKEFQFNIPQRWSIAHLYQAILNHEPHVKNISHITTLAGYVHYLLTGQNVIGIGDASGMFPIDEQSKCFNKEFIHQFDTLIQNQYLWKLSEILPTILMAGEKAGVLTKKGAMLLDIGGDLQEGIPFCPPEGDAQTGMVATNSVKKCTCNVSAGTSVFSMAVLNKPLKKPHKEIDVVVTPVGDTVAMVHCNNCCGDIDAYVHIFSQLLQKMNLPVDMNELYKVFYDASLTGDIDCGGILTYNFYSGEPVIGLNQGSPMLVRKIDSRFTLENLSRSLLFSSLAALKIGNDLLFKEENLVLEVVYAQGGLFKSGSSGQEALAAALNTPVRLFENASEGGAWGMAILAAYTDSVNEYSLEEYLEKKIFISSSSILVEPNDIYVKSFEQYVEEYKKGLKIEKALSKNE